MRGFDIAEAKSAVRGERFPFHGVASRIGIEYLHTSGNRSVLEVGRQGFVMWPQSLCGQMFCNIRFIVPSLLLLPALCLDLKGRLTTAWDMAGEIERKVILVLNEAPIHEDV
jgi:hypothetical protein